MLEELGFVDVYLTREYVEASTLLEPGRPLFLRTDQAVFPANPAVSEHSTGSPTPPSWIARIPGLPRIQRVATQTRDPAAPTTASGADHDVPR